MPLSTSPRLLSPAEISGDVRPQEDQKVIPSTELPFRTQVSPSTSPQPYEETMPMATANRALATSENNHTLQAPMVFDPEAMQWSAQGHFPHNSLVQDTFCTPSLFAPYTACTEYAQQPFNGMPYNANHAFKYPIDCTSPRIFQNVGFTGRPVDMTASYPPAAYFHSPPQLHPTPSLPDNSTSELAQLNDDWDLHYGTLIKHEDHQDYNSPYSDMSRASTPYSTGHEDEPIDREQPYAQLIYRALLDAPEHTMVLRDIYDWFRRHTDKATHSETKGWQNSIRHNLSMNGVSLAHVVFTLFRCLARDAPSLFAVCLDISLTFIRLSRRSTRLPTQPPRASCGASPRPHFTKASNLQPATAQKHPTSARIAHNPSLSDKPLVQRVAMLLAVLPTCVGRSALARLACITALHPAATHTPMVAMAASGKMAASTNLPRHTPTVSTRPTARCPCPTTRPEMMHLSRPYSAWHRTISLRHAAMLRPLLPLLRPLAKASWVAMLHTSWSRGLASLYSAAAPRQAQMTLSPLSMLITHGIRMFP
jgi:hypothetical protein